jgi:uncharacterized protein YbjQ (UPF0145 family)
MPAHSIKDEMITSALQLPGYEIIENIGIVRGITVRSNNIFGSFFGSIRSIFGGNIRIFAEMCDKARSDAFSEMKANASGIGANAIISFRYDATELSQGITEVLAYGTAVTVVKKVDP